MTPRAHPRPPSGQLAHDPGVTGDAICRPLQTSPLFLMCAAARAVTRSEQHRARTGCRAASTALSRGQTTGRGSSAHARHARRPGEPFDPEPRGSRARSTCQPTGLTSSERGEAAVMSRAERRLCLSSPSPPDCSAAPAGARDRDRSRQHGNRHNPSTRGTPRGMLGRPEASSNVERRSTMTRRAGWKARLVTTIAAPAAAQDLVSNLDKTSLGGLELNEYDIARARATLRW